MDLRHFFNRFLFILGSLGIHGGICAMDFPDTQARVKGLMSPLQQLVNQKAGRKIGVPFTIGPAFRETWQLVCRQAREDLQGTKSTIESEQFKSEMAHLTGQLKENLNRWLVQSRGQMFVPDQAQWESIGNTFLSKFYALDGQIASFNRQTRALFQLAEREECTPEFFEYAQTAPDAIVRKAYWQDIGDNYASVKEWVNWLLGFCRR